APQQTDKPQPDQRSGNGTDQKQPVPARPDKNGALTPTPAPSPDPKQPPVPQAKPQPGLQPGDQPSPQEPRTDQTAAPTQNESKGGQGENQPTNGKPSSPAETIRRIAQRQREAQQRQDLAQKMRERANDLARNMTPEQREKWARQWQKQSGDNQ